jgi:SAM-dependent methyltransferase
MPSADPTPEELYARLYDATPLSWPGEIEWYLELAREAPEPTVLEIASGTGRVALQLAREGLAVVGVDASPEMVAVARERASGLPNARFELGDMRSFDLREQFGLAIVPAHSFQFMTTPGDQVAALANFGRHLLPGGRLVLHLDHDSLESLLAMDGSERPGKVRVDPVTSAHHRPFYAWTYDSARQDATLRMGWDELGGDALPFRRRALAPMVLHVPSAAEMEHAIARAGLAPVACWGDFSGAPFEARSADMIWVATAGTR